MDFPINDLMDESACYQFLLALFHPQGLHCPRCQTRDGLRIQHFYREPVLNYRCTHCRRVFNADIRGPKLTYNVTTVGADRQG